MPDSRQRGLTLIELLVVIAILGILASVVLSNVSAAKTSAQRAKTEASLRSAQTTATYCMDDGKDLNVPDIANVICIGQGNWPAPVGLGWTYGDVGSCGFDGDTGDGTFLYCATDGVETITCTQSGCGRT